ncbi:acylphosphatase [Roseibacterium sp. SDUM158017]|uniref:acylphosphatase n=1 Tax=Roseicyclus salinarum TaxID=3036773 RepID=UPI00241537DB|nr:acylphosphatase [Roseibacterium sp. SDUM158017]MDG4650303.1 acylphosphatase [Roseibacterium sp. SDUM158017]
MSTEPTAMIVSVTGRVQGVSFRAWTKGEADARGLAGWVRNEADGSVSALIEGPPDAVGTMMKALERGPALARVDRVTAMPGAPTDAQDFEILDDAP